MKPNIGRRAGALALAGMVAAASVVALPSAADAAKKKGKKPKYKVSVSASSTTVKSSNSFTLSGRVTKPKAPRKKVSIQRYVAGKWSTIATDKLDKKSRYSAAVNVGKTLGVAKFRVVKAKSKKARKGKSRLVSVNVVSWGTVKAWGDDDAGQLGNGGNAADSLTPVDVSGLREVVEIAGNHNGETTYARTIDGSVYAWGANYAGQIGNGATGDPVTSPVKINLTDVKQLAPMAEAGAALKKDGTVWTWGDNGNGQLGNGGFGADTNVPAKVPNLSGVKAIAGNYAGMYALKGDGTVWAWGYNSYYDLGQGNDDDDSAVPLKVQGLPGGITQIAAVGDTGYALDGLGRVWAWGYNGNGELGNGTIGTESGVPRKVIGLSGIKRLYNGAFDTPYVVSSTGVTYSWGQGDTGKLGNGEFDDSPFPVEVSGIINPKAMAGSDSTGFALKTDGTVWSFGDNEVLGDGSLADRALPGRIPALRNVSLVTGGLDNGYAVIG